MLKYMKKVNSLYEIMNMLIDLRYYGYENITFEKCQIADFIRHLLLTLL